MIELPDTNSCFGCTACASVCRAGAITMCRDAEGFEYPSVDASRCVGCGRCDDICPSVHAPSMKHPADAQRVYAARCRDGRELRLSASGGVFGVLARHVLARDGVVYGVAYSSAMEARHVAAEDASSLSSLHDSKYVQSHLGSTFRDVQRQLHDGRDVLFSGTPCQVAGLRRFLRQSYTNLLTCDILCHSVASPRIFSDYVRFVERHTRGRMVNLSLRDKSRGWGSGATRIDYADGTSLYDSYWASIWAVAYPLHLITRPSCHACPFCSGQRVGDISIGDFWGVERALPQSYCADGVSLVLVNTEHGRQLWGDVQADMFVDASTLDDAMQPVLMRHSSPDVRRDEFWHDYQRGGFDAVVRKYWHYSPLLALRQRLKLLLRIGLRETGKEVERQP